MKEGDTEAIVFTLGNAGVPFSLSGYTVTMAVHDSAGAVVATTGGKVVVDPDQGANPGKVTYSPGSTDLLATKTPHRASFTAQDGDGKQQTFPEDGYVYLKVQPR